MYHGRVNYFLAGCRYYRRLQYNTRIYKCAMKKFGFNSQMRNEPFLIVIYHSSLVKGAMNAVRVCKLHNGVKKRPNFFYFQWLKVDQVCNEYLRSYLN